MLDDNERDNKNELVKMRKTIRIRKTSRKVIVKEKNHGQKNLTIVKMNQAHIECNGIGSMVVAEELNYK